MKYKIEKILLLFILAFFISIITIHSYLFYRYSLDVLTLMNLRENPFQKIEKESFQHTDTEPIDFYVITLKNPERMENIEKQKDILKKQGTEIYIELIDAVVGKDLNFNDLIKQEIVSTHYDSPYIGYETFMKKEIGCFLSHTKIHKIIKEKQHQGYSVIFEDDFDISSEHFMSDVQNAVQYLKNEMNNQFDILYLGINTYYHGNQVHENIYELDNDNDILGTHAMLINNQNIDTIIENTKVIKNPIDMDLTHLIHANKLKAYVLNPHIVNTQVELETTIFVENFYMNSSKLKHSMYDE